MKNRVKVLCYIKKYCSEGYQHVEKISKCQQIMNSIEYDHPFKHDKDWKIVNDRTSNALNFVRYLNKVINCGIYDDKDVIKILKWFESVGKLSNLDKLLAELENIQFFEQNKKSN